MIFVLVKTSNPSSGEFQDRLLEGAPLYERVGQAVEELAQTRLGRYGYGCAGGVVGATRPAIEDGWVSRAHQVGQSGKIVAPALYIACGVSGATQHVSGMSGSGYVVAINKDEDAPIFDVADVGIVGDVAKVLPLMIEEIRQRKAE